MFFNQLKPIYTLLFAGRTENSSEQYYISERQKEDLELPLLDLATIVKATNNFLNGNKLGEGGFGPVYKVATWQNTAIIFAKNFKLI